MNDSEFQTIPDNNLGSDLSYKFQRLREKLRKAISDGDFNGKLPGERALAKRFHVNAKTLSKALTDLAAEGLLERSIGRGTYVKGSAPSSQASKRWLMICDVEQTGWDLLRLICEAHPDCEVVTDLSAMRPSFLNQFSAVVDLSRQTPDTFIRDLVVRNIPVVGVGKEPKTYSTHSVLFDGHYALERLSRELILGGHRKFGAVASDDCEAVFDTLRDTAGRFAPETTVEKCKLDQLATAVDQGTTAFVCQNVDWAARVKSELEKLKVSIPDQVSVAAVGTISDKTPVSGYFIHRSEKVKAIVRLLQDQMTRPTTLWLAGAFENAGTTAPRPINVPAAV